MSSPGPKSEDLLSHEGDEDEEDMTSVMSSDQRKLLQQAASNSKEADTLERDTAKPPPSAEADAAAAEIVIPKAPAVPSERGKDAPKVEVKSEPAAEAPAPVGATQAAAKVVKPAPTSGMATWELVAFVLLAVAVAVALRM
jgi:hypothetical protein